MPAAGRSHLAGRSTTSERLRPQIQANRRRAAVLLGSLAGVIFLVVWLAAAILGAPFLGLLPALAAAGGLTALAYARADELALAAVGASPADPLVQARLHNLVEGLCSASGLPKPSLHLVEDEDSPNALALGRDPRHASLVVTSGLLDKLSRIELEGVLAHELSHIKSFDTLVSTLAAGLVGRVSPSLVPKVIGAQRETRADVTGAALTRYPPGLISALEKLRDDPSVLFSPNRAITQLWIDAPDVGPSLPSLDERIQALREL